MTATDTLLLEPFTTDHIADAWALSQAEHWPHRQEDWALALEVSSGVVALQEGRVVGTAIATPFGSVAALNMIIVAADMRGRGLGRRLMQAAMDMVNAQELRLVATADGLPLYEKLGFAVTGTLQQVQGLAKPAAPCQPVCEGALPLAQMVKLDTAATGMAREKLIGRIADTGTVLSCGEGFAILRDFGRGKVVGPIVAQDLDTAKALLAGSATRCAGTFLRLDTPSPALAEFAHTLGLAPAGGGTCMVKTPALRAVSPVTTFGLISQAYG